MSQSAPSANGNAPHVTAGIPHWFDYCALFDRVVENCPPSSWLVEIGIFHGASLRHLAHSAKAADKNLTVVGVDWCRGSAEHRKHIESLPGRNLAGAAMETLITAGVADDCALVCAPSQFAARFVPDGSCAMVFIDAAHDYDSVKADIRCWLPKVAEKGILAGHDWFTFPGVRQAVCDVFGKKDWMCRDSESCWEVQL